MSKLSILVNSCDNYSDVWEPFFRILEKTWPEAKEIPVFLNTEEKTHSDPFFNVQTLNCTDEGGKRNWGKRLRDALDRIDSDYIVFLLEDFFFEEPIQHSEVLRCLDFIERDPKIVVISMIPQNECEDESYCASHESELFPGFIQRKKRTDYKLSAGPSIWRKSLLKKWTLDKDTPWGWEFFGSKRTWFSDDKFYCRSKLAPAIFVYDFLHGGAVHRGMWVGYKMRELKEKYKIEIDMSQRGIEDDYLSVPKEKRSIIKRLPSIIKNKYALFSSLCYGFFHR